MGKVVIRWLARRLARRPFRLIWWDGSREVFGKGDPEFEIRFRRRSGLLKMILAPDPFLGDAYVDGLVEIHPLRSFFDAYLEGPHAPSPRWKLWLARLSSGGSVVSQQYRHIQSHYDRGNAFFSLWLDSSKTYSCAYFPHWGVSLKEAQQAKRELVLKKAFLRPGQRLLDIGSGWGTLLVEAAREYQVYAHGITLSRQQYEHTQALIRREGLERRVTVELKDYRELAAVSPQAFDRIVSIGMMEHVGRGNLAAFLSSIRRLLAPGGVCVLHSMTRIHERPVSPWIRKHAFPGCYVPSWREVIQSLPSFSFHLVDVESLRRHYAKTLEMWAERFEKRLDEVRRLGFSDSFIRMWRFYLQACAASFRHGVLDLHQLVFTLGVHNGLPMTREHLYRGPRPAISVDASIPNPQLSFVAPGIRSPGSSRASITAGPRPTTCRGDETIFFTASEASTR